MASGVPMARSRPLLAVVGAVAVVVGAGVAIQPGLAGVVAIPTIPVSAIGGLALLFALLIWLRRRDTTIRCVEPPEVEAMREFPRPGTGFDESLRRTHGLGVEAARRRRESREDLATVTITVLEVAEGYSPEAAEHALQEGTWTDDPVAAACFAAEPPSEGFRGLLSRYVDRRPQTEREFVAVIDALQRKLDGVGRA